MPPVGTTSHFIGAKSRIKVCRNGFFCAIGGKIAVDMVSFPVATACALDFSFDRAEIDT